MLSWTSPTCSSKFTWREAVWCVERYHAHCLRSNFALLAPDRKRSLVIRLTLEPADMPLRASTLSPRLAASGWQIMTLVAQYKYRNIQDRLASKHNDSLAINSCSSRSLNHLDRTSEDTQFSNILYYHHLVHRSTRIHQARHHECPIRLLELRFEE
jgi:hypothetical protein